MAIVLIIKTEDGTSTELPILSKVVLGRSGSTDFKISDAKMSANHCTFDVNSAGELVFTDLGSTNGSFLNNSQIQKSVVRLNDVIRVGNTLIKIDESKLTPNERISIGSSSSKRRDRDRTLPDMASYNPNKMKEDNAKKASDAERKAKWSGDEDNVIDREKPTGNTKLLTLDKNNKNKKVKKK